MPKKEAPLDYLRRWIPEQAAPSILQYLNHYQVHLTITRERKSVSVSAATRARRADTSPRSLS